MIVVDASVVLELLLRTPAAPGIETRLFSANAIWHAPHLLDVEVAQVLRRYTFAGEITATRGLEAIGDLADLPLTSYPHHPFLSRIWELRDNVTAYDAAYISLAEALAVPLVTLDAKLASAPGHDAVIEVLR